MADAYIERDNTQRWELLQDGVAVEQGAVTRVTLRFPSSASSGDDAVCLDTDSNATIELQDSGTVVQASIGQVSGLKPGLYRCWLTVFDAQNTNGIAWAQPTIRVRDWPGC